MLIVASILIVLLAGDFASTFFYHAPQHVWGTLHLRTHHDARLKFWDQAVVSKNPGILLDGFFGAVPYFVIAAICAYTLSPIGAGIGLLLGWSHVLWRHTTVIGWKSPAWLVAFSRATSLVLPEDHAKHHRDPEIAFGDLFNFYDAPARAYIKWLRAQGWGRRRSQNKLRRTRAKAMT